MRSIQRKHPWIFSGAISSDTSSILNGDIVTVQDSAGSFLARGHFQNATIAVRILSFEDREIDIDFFIDKLSNAYSLRLKLNLINENNNICRLVHGEGDGLPGLIIDYYNGAAIIQCHSIGMYNSIELIKNALVKVIGTKLVAIYSKSSDTLSIDVQDRFLYGDLSTPHISLENEVKYAIDWITGQKTGFFIDQRDNRSLLGKYAHDKKILNAFSYSGGFSLSAIKGGAKLVHSLDSSKKAIHLAEENVSLNGYDDRHESIVEDAMEYMKNLQQDYDIIILDPPAFAKHRNKRHKAVQGYKRLNAHAISHIKPGGIIFTFSCSQVVDKLLFTNTIIAASIEASIAFLRISSEGLDMLDLRYRTILKVAIPLMGSTFIQSVVMITDSSFLSRYSTDAFDAGGNAGLIYITLFIAMIGMGDASQIMMARRIGEKNENLLSRIFTTTMLANLILALALFCIIQLLLPSVIMSYSAHEEIGLGQVEFIKIRGFALFFGVISLAINAYFMAIGKTFVVLISAVLVAISNIGLDYALIFGHYGLPSMGLKGAALASTLADGLGMIFLLILLLIHKTQKEHKLFSSAPNMQSFLSLYKLGSPIILQGTVALATWTVFFAWIEQMGKYELTVSQNIRSIYFIAFVPLWGFGATTKTYVSQYLGNKEFDKIKIIIRRVQLLTLIFLFIFFHGAFLYPETLIKIINPDIEYTSMSASILQFVSGSIFMYGIGSVYFNTINGSGNTRYTFYVELISVAVYLLAAYLLIKVYETSIFWVWTVEYIYFAFLILASVLYLKFFNWQHKQI